MAAREFESIIVDRKTALRIFRDLRGHLLEGRNIGAIVISEMPRLIRLQPYFVAENLTEDERREVAGEWRRDHEDGGR